jgi:hypothetical protein
MPNTVNGNNDSVYRTDIDVYGKEIKTVPGQPKQIGIDTNKTLFHNIAN